MAGLKRGEAVTRRCRMWSCLAFCAALALLQAACVCAQVPTSSSVLGQGFLSLACGYVGGSSFRDLNGITWQTDINYVATGSLGIGSAALELQALRFFPNYVKNCYNLPLSSPGSVYLVRAGFLYGNYDSRNAPPDFKLSLGTTIWVDSVKLDSGSTAVHYEAVFSATTSSISVCLIRGASGDPFINSLELRPAPSGAYGIASTSPVYLYAVERVNFGGPSLRYPKDGADRYWTSWTVQYPDLVPQYFNLSSPNAAIVYTASAIDQPPQAVLQTAIRPTVPSRPITFTVPNPLSVASSQSYAPLYLSVFSAELSITGFDLPFESFQCDGFQVNATKLDSRFAAYRIGFTNQVFSNPSITCSLTRHKNSLVDPLINGLEVFSIQPIVAGTYGPDVLAMAIINVNFSSNPFFKQWPAGDPCLPVPWDGVICSSGSIPRVVGIVLPGGDFKLDGTIPPAIGLLTALTQLVLNDNNLSGPIPDELRSLRNLSILNVADNQLSGMFPLWLNTSYLPHLTQVFVQNNYFTGIFADDLNDLGANFSYLGGNQLCSVSDVTCAGQSAPNTPPVTPPVIPGAPPRHSSNDNRLAKIIGGVGGGLIVILLIIALLAWYFSERNWPTTRGEGPKKSYFRQLLNVANLGKYSGGFRKRDWKRAPLLRLSSNSGLLKADGVSLRRFRYDELKQATNKFKTTLIEDDLGVLFLGSLLRENKKVGVKILSDSAQMTDDQFRLKVDLIAKLRHPNIVPLIGFCMEGSKQILVSEHMDGGELHRLLHETADTRVLSWRERLNVALGAAKGLDYLHNRFSPPVIHGDISSRSILLNDLLEAKIANAGLKSVEPEESFPNGSGSASSSQRLGYADPEALLLDQLTEKSDVYSFGVVLLEVLCGRQPVSKFPPFDNHMQLVDWVKQTLNGGNIEEIVDSKMRKDYNEQALSKYTSLALNCTESEANQRPNMDFVVRELEETIQLQ